jgi:hypothetical protein
MMMMIRSVFFSFLLLLITVSVFSQDSDFGLWYEVNAEKSFGKKFDVYGNVTIRTFDNASITEEAFMELGASYSPKKYIGFAATYRVGNFLEDDDLYHIRHKWFADIKGSLPAGNFVFSARLRLQIMTRTYFEDASKDKAD